MAMRGPVASEPIQCGSWQRDVSVLGAFTTVDMNHAPARIDIAHLKIESLLHTKSQ